MVVVDETNDNLTFSKNARPTNTRITIMTTFNALLRIRELKIAAPGWPKRSCQREEDNAANLDAGEIVEMVGVRG